MGTRRFALPGRGCRRARLTSRWITLYRCAVPRTLTARLGMPRHLLCPLVIDKWAVCFRRSLVVASCRKAVLRQHISAGRVVWRSFLTGSIPGSSTREDAAQGVFSPADSALVGTFWAHSETRSSILSVHLVGHVIKVIREQMPVLIERHSRRFMAKLRLHSLDVGPRRDHQRGRSVPQLMDGHPRELLVCGLAPLDRRAEPMRRRRRPQTVAHLRGTTTAHRGPCRRSPAPKA
jgi:hypothetical protein